MLSLQEDQLSSLSRGVQSLAHNQDKFMAAMTTQLGDLANQIQQLASNPNTEQMEAATPVVTPAPTIVQPAQDFV